MYLFSCRSADQKAPRTRRSGLAIVATGGYGRCELNPLSDIDIAFIPSEEEDPWVEAVVHMAFKLVMDVFLSFREIRVGYSFRPLAEISPWDLVTLTALLDARHLCGDKYLSEALAANLREHLSPLDLVLELRAEIGKWTPNELCHGLSQAFQKRDLPRSLLYDNGSAMVAAETEQGLTRLGVLFENTLPFSPYQNGKQESFWGQVEGRLLPMLEGVVDLTLDQLNDASQPWVELEYNRKVHSELNGQTPLQRFLGHKNVAHPCPSAQALQHAFTTEVRRVQRRSDGTLTLEGIRFEVPSRFGHLTELWLRYASWDLSTVHLADPKTGALLSRIYPVDKKKNAEGRRAPRTSAPTASPPATPTAMAPLLQKLIRQYATPGLPPAYVPQPENPDNRSRPT